MLGKGFYHTVNFMKWKFFNVVGFTVLAGISITLLFQTWTSTQKRQIVTKHAVESKSTASTQLSQNALQQVLQVNPAALEYSTSDKYGVLTYLEAKDGSLPNPSRAIQSLSPEALTKNYLQNYGNLFGVTNPSEELAVTRILSDSSESTGTIQFKGFTPSSPLGSMVHVRMQQRYQNIPVYGAELITHLTPEGRVKSINGQLIPHLKIANTVPGISADTAQTTAINQWRSEGNGNEMTTTTPQLAIIDPGLFTDDPPQASLAWMFDIESNDKNQLAKKTYFVDAQTGSLIIAIDQIYESLERYVHDCSRGNCPVARSEGNGPVSTNESDEVDKAYKYSGLVYDFYSKTFNRDGVDGRGGPIHLYVRSNNKCPNAHANSMGVFFCPGWAVLDVVGHEMTHIVTFNSANFIFRNQGATLHESTSDIFSSNIDNNWLVGEETEYAKTHKGFFRDMADPPHGGQADRVCYPRVCQTKRDLSGGACYFVGSEDAGGAHINNGIPNKAAVLMADGGNFNGCAIQGIGRDKMIQIHYRALTRYHTASTKFVDYTNNLVAACKTLYDEFTCKQVAKALQATEMHIQRNACPANGKSSRPACEGDSGVASTPAPQPTTAPGIPTPTSPPVDGTTAAIWTTDAGGSRLSDGTKLAKGTVISICYRLISTANNSLTIDRGGGLTRTYGNNVITRKSCLTGPLGELSSAAGSPHIYTLKTGGTTVSTTLYVLPRRSSTRPPDGRPTSPPAQTTPPSRPTVRPPQNNAAIQNLVNSVSEQKIREYITNLQDRDESVNESPIVDSKQTRYSTLSGNETEANYIARHFESNGLSRFDDDYFQPFSISGKPTRNIIGRIIGDNPNEVVIILGHMDSTAQMSGITDPAPGADDNGSGTAVIMEAARVLGRQRFRKTLEFFATSGEEQGLLGSRHYLANLPMGKKIIGAINVDMISYPPAKTCIRFYYNDRIAGSKDLADRLLINKTNFGIAIDFEQPRHTTLDRSDHASFWARGIPAVFGFECASNPNYHTINDTLDGVSISTVTKTTQLVVATLAQLAELQ